jgi:hypothetical protein
MITADLTRNQKQSQYVDDVLAAAFGDNPYRYLFYGGAIRSAKTFSGLIALILLCRIFPGSKWCVIRKSFAHIEKTTLPSIQKILANSPNWRWKRDKTNYFVEYIRNGSRIYFAGENFTIDPKLDWMLGFECNGFLLEQVEELQEILFNMCITRAGSWYIPNMPAPLILATFNPTQTWVKQRVFEPWRDGTLQPPYYFQEAKAEDNPFVTQEQYTAWEHLPADMYAKFVEANWEFAKPPNVFAYAYDERPGEIVAGKRLGGHHKDVGYNSDYPLFLSFDFNVEPITCLAAQHDPYLRDWIHVIKEYRLLVSDIWALTDHIVSNVPEAFFMVTGDASGTNRQAITKGNKNYYQIIKQQLAIGTQQLKVPRGNPRIRNTRVLCNALLEKHTGYWINTVACPHLSIDLNTVVVDENGDIDEGKDKRKGHLLDGWRYYNWTFHRDFIDKNLYTYFDSD